MFDLHQAIGPMLSSAAIMQQWSISQLRNHWWCIWWFSISLHFQNMYPQKTDNSVGLLFVLVPLQEVGTMPLSSVRTEGTKCITGWNWTATFLWTLISSYSPIITYPHSPTFPPPPFLSRHMIAEVLTKGSNKSKAVLIRILNNRLFLFERKCPNNGCFSSVPSKQKLMLLNDMLLFKMG